jgi:hypothetical protein
VQRFLPIKSTRFSAFQYCVHGPKEAMQSLGHGEHLLAHRQAGEDVIRRVRRCLHHAPGVERGADTPAFAEISDKVVVPAVVTPRLGKAVRKDASLQIFAKGLAEIGFWRVVVALPDELTRAGERVAGLKVFGNGLVEKGALGVARVLELGHARHGDMNNKEQPAKALV